MRFLCPRDKPDVSHLQVLAIQSHSSITDQAVGHGELIASIGLYTALMMK